MKQLVRLSFVAVASLFGFICRRRVKPLPCFYSGSQTSYHGLETPGKAERNMKAIRHLSGASHATLPVASSNR